MQMKRIIVALYVTLTVGLAAAAVTQSDIVGARTAGTLQEAWVSGASAPTYSIYKGWDKGCDAGSEAIFTSSATVGQPGTTGYFNAYACKRSGVVSVMYHSVQGGSISAYSPFMNTHGTNGDLIPPVKLTRIKNLGTASCPVVGTWNGVPAYAGCQTVVGATAADNGPTIPSGGFSEVEGSVFGLSNVFSVGNEVPTGLVQVYGIAVSKNLYRALQVAQGIYASTLAADSADPNYDPVNAPSIFSAEYTSIIANASGYQGDWSPMLGTAGLGKNVYLYREVPGAGTQAISNVHFLVNPCALGSAGSIPTANAADSTATFIVSEEVSDDNVKTQLTSAVAAGNYAIGVLPTAYNWRIDPVSRNGYRFVSMDGAHPEGNGDIAMARKTAVNGHNTFVSELVTFVPNSAAGTFGETLIGQISSAFVLPVSCADVQRGFYLDPGFAPSPACTVGAEIGKGTNAGNSCAPIQLFY